MTHTHSIRRMMSLSSKARSRASAVAAFALAVTAAGCTKDSLLKVTDPDILSPGDYTTPAGATPLRVGVIADFASRVRWRHRFIHHDHRQPRRRAPRQRHVRRSPDDQRPQVGRGEHRDGSRLPRHAACADRCARARLAILATTAPTPLSNRGELYMLLAYSEMFLGEGWCSGVPFSSEDGTTTTLGQPLTTDAMFHARGRALRLGARTGRNERARAERLEDRKGSRIRQPRQVHRGRGGGVRRADELHSHHVALGEQQHATASGAARRAARRATAS